MRTTLTLDDALAAELKEMAHRSGLPFKRVVNQMLRAGIDAARRPRPKGRVRLKTFALGPPSAPLDRALQLAAALEDEEIVRKLRLRK
jgi:hypothetical protein